MTRTRIEFTFLSAANWTTNEQSSEEELHHRDEILNTLASPDDLRKKKPNPKRTSIFLKLFENASVQLSTLYLPTSKIPFFFMNYEFLYPNLKTESLPPPTVNKSHYIEGK